MEIITEIAQCNFPFLEVLLFLSSATYLLAEISNKLLNIFHPSFLIFNMEYS